MIKKNVVSELSQEREQSKGETCKKSLNWDRLLKKLQVRRETDVKTF